MSERAAGCRRSVWVSLPAVTSRPRSHRAHSSGARDARVASAPRGPFGRWAIVSAVLAAAFSPTVPGRLLAQESVFGALGFGLPDDGLSVRSRGMGNTATALPGIHFGFRNAASLAVFDRTGVSIASTLQSRRPEDASGQSTQNSAELPFVQLAFPLGYGFVLGGGYYRYLDFDGFVDTSTSFRGDSLPVRLTTDGGISVLSPQLARWFSTALRVGGGVDFYIGSRERLRRVEFDPAVGVSTADSVAFGFEGIGASFGVQAAPLRGLLLGAAYRSPVTLDGDLEVAAGFEGAGDEGGGATADLRREFQVELPASVYAGASYRFGEALLVAAELESARWSDFAVDGARDPRYDDVLGAGAGVEYSLPRRLLILSKGSAVRVGGRTRELPLRFGGRTVRERALTLGLGQLVGIGASNLDLSLEVGKRGSLATNGIQEPFVRLGVALSAYEKWSAPEDPSRQGTW